MISKQAGFSILALSALVSITSWIAIENSEIPPDTGEVLQTGFITNLTLHQTNQLGQLAYSAKVDNITQFNNGNTIFTNLSATSYSQDNLPPWHLTSPQGRTLDNNNQVILSGGVILFRDAVKNYAPIKVESESVTIYPQQNYAATTYPITIYQPGTKNITTAIGAKAYLKTQQVVLLSQVNSVYEPTSHP